MNNVDLAYIAGIIDGDGSIVVSKNSYPMNPLKSPTYCAYLSVTNTQQALLEWLKATVGGSVYLTKRKKMHSNWFPTWEWRCLGKEVTRVLTLVLPYLKLKKRQAEEVITFQESIDLEHRFLPRTEEIKAFQETQYVLVSGLNHSKEVVI